MKSVKFSVNSNHRIWQCPDGSLLIQDVIRIDAGEYSCKVENDYGQDSVIHHLIVNINLKKAFINPKSNTNLFC